ncbi:hypothetical protein LTR95_013015 [Oleoguttula sp. CCFEE 5521]
MLEADPSRIDFADTFVVKVGDPPKSFTIPANTFTARSNFFKAAIVFTMEVYKSSYRSERHRMLDARTTNIIIDFLI